MLALKILDKVRWHDQWSAEIGRKFSVWDSTHDLFIFDRHSREEILELLKDAPGDLYELFEIEEAPAEGCDFLADSGRCYNRH
ncbi:MAG: hypothetical protein IH614_18000 [Desulfuromonadales bacterium]|nr:hypothetical protein [Desulfuromonadales bacterium]